MKCAAIAVGITLMPSACAFTNPRIQPRTFFNDRIDDSSLVRVEQPSVVWQLNMKRNTEENPNTRRIESLSAASIAEDWNLDEEKKLNFDSDFLESFLFPVISTSFLITGNTVGAGMLILPELAAGPGMGISSSIFAGAFLINLVSGLLIAEVGINQHDSSGNDVPSSFKDFAEVNLNSQSAATIISFISIFVNALVMAFNTVKVGDIGYDMVQGIIPSDAISMAWVLGSAALVGSQTFTSLSTVTSFLVAGLFFSFAGLLLPGLTHMTADPITILTTPGTETDVMASAGQLAPVILMSLVYQNIVPTVTKILNYDRNRTTIAISLGSFIPLVMYVAWAFAVNGGGVDTSVGLDGPLMTIFSLTTIAGSSIGCVMSLAEEFETFLTDKPQEGKDTEVKVDKFSVPAVMASIGCAWVTAQFFANDLNDALKVAGSFGSPLLYGVLPVIMAFTQRKELKENELSSLKNQMPAATLGLLGVASTGFVGNELIQSAIEMLNLLPL